MYIYPLHTLLSTRTAAFETPTVDTAVIAPGIAESLLEQIHSLILSAAILDRNKCKATLSDLRTNWISFISYAYVKKSTGNLVLDIFTNLFFQTAVAKIAREQTSMFSFGPFLFAFFSRLRCS